MPDFALPEQASAILVALGSGLIICVERERRDGGAVSPAMAGVRTFAITSLLGVFAALSESVVLLGVVAAGVVALTAVAHFASVGRSDGKDSGLTTEMALITTFVIGVLSA